tara:strand:- start:1687 stop:2508 length:822 start_codon:yes stop_codon:yes gene_type:complete
MAISTQAPLLVLLGFLHRRSASYGWREMSRSTQGADLKKTAKTIWMPTWRAGLGSFLSLGSRQGAGVVLAQYSRPELVAGFLLAQNVISLIMVLSSAPVQSVLHTMSEYYAVGKTELHNQLAAQALTRSLWVVVAACGMIGLMIIPSLKAFGLQGMFVTAPLWAIMSFALYFQRYGAAHLQHYSITNHIFWHRLDGGTGVMNIALAAWLIPTYGAWGAAIANLSSVATIYAWIPVLFVVRRFDFDWFENDFKPVSLITCCFVIVLGFAIWIGY